MNLHQKGAKLILLVLPFFILNCGHIKIDKIKEEEQVLDAPSLHKETELFLEVPFFKQQVSLCAVSALQSVFAYYNIEQSFDEIKENVFNEKINSTHIIDIITYAKKLNLNAYLIKAMDGNIVASIYRNEPVIALIDSGFLSLSKGHYVVITGVEMTGDIRKGESSRIVSFYIHDGKNKNKKISVKDFNKKWKKAGNQIIVITP